MMIFVENLPKAVTFMMAAVVVDSMRTLSMTIMTTFRFVVGLCGALADIRIRSIRHLIAGSGRHLIADMRWRRHLIADRGWRRHLIADRGWRRHLTVVMSASGILISNASSRVNVKSLYAH
jgi:hypothetical protein